MVSTSAENRQKRGNAEIINYLQDAPGARNLAFGLAVTHDRYGSSAQSHLSSLLTHPRTSLHAAARKKISAHRAQYVNHRNMSFMSAITSTSTRSTGFPVGRWAGRGGLRPSAYRYGRSGLPLTVCGAEFACACIL